MTNLKVTAAAGPIGAEITGADVSRPLDTEIFQAIDGAIDGFGTFDLKRHTKLSKIILIPLERPPESHVIIGIAFDAGMYLCSSKRTLGVQ